MELCSMCPLAVTSFVWLPRPGTHVLTIVCKATYSLERGVSPLAEAQEEVAEHDNHWDDDERASLYAASDRTPPKRRVDVVLVGGAFAPGGSPVRSLVATLEVGDVKKSIEVCCDRSFTYDGRLLEGAPFARMALRWERAAGGPETANPVGVRMGGAPSAEGVIAIPNLQPRRARIAWPGDMFEPVGFGPIAPSWPGRARALRGLPRDFLPARWFERPLPAGFDQAYFNVAPPDQQLPALAPEARIALTNLHPRFPRLVTNLARVRPRAVVERAGGRAPVELACDTLWIDTDRGIATLTFRGVVVLSRPDELGRVVVALESDARERTHMPPLAALVDASPAAEPAPRVATLVDTSPAALAGALPFLAAKIGGDAAAPRAEPPPARSPAPPRASAEETTGAIDVDALRAQKAKRDALPFAPKAPLPVPTPPPRKRAWADESTGTIEIDKLRAETMPFSPATKPIAAEAGPPGVSEASPVFWQKLVVGASDEARETPRVPQVPRAGASALLALAAPTPTLASTRPPSPATPLPQAIATPLGPPRAPATAAPGADALPIEVYAAVKAALWRGEGSTRAEVERRLRELGVDEERYLEGEERLLEALAEEASAGRATLARAVRAALKRAVRQPRASQASGNVPAV